jgi:hypothetical protein
LFWRTRLCKRSEFARILAGSGEAGRGLWAEQAARVVQAVGVAVARFNRPVLVGGAGGRKKGSGRVREKRDNKKVNEKLAV